MEARISEAWKEVRAYSEKLQDGESDEADDPQHRFARVCFDSYKHHAGTPTRESRGTDASCR